MIEISMPPTCLRRNEMTGQKGLMFFPSGEKERVVGPKVSRLRELPLYKGDRVGRCGCTGHCNTTAVTESCMEPSGHFREVSTM